MRIYTPETFPSSTLDADAVNALPVVKMRPSWRVSPSAGMGCYGDAPGFPTYFLRAVYDHHGNTPKNGPDSVLLGTDGEWHEFSTSNRNERARALYKPLPVEHPRAQAWIAATMAHTQHCYADVERPEYSRPGTLIFPVSDYKLKTFRDNPQWTEEYRAAAKNEVEAFNRYEIDRATRIATVGNHQGVRSVREIYPDWSPRDPSIVNGIPGYTHADWWEDSETPPELGQCPGAQNVSREHTDAFCQYCGASNGVIWQAAGLL